MYCKCNPTTRKSVNSEANGKKFKICSKSLGGCGKEIENKVFTAKDLRIFIDGKEVQRFDGQYGIEITPLDFTVTYEENNEN